MAKRKQADTITYGRRGRRRSQQHHPFTLSSSPSPSNDTVDMFFPDSDKVDTSQKPLPPPRPTSQKAASMPAEPEEEKIDMLMTVTGGMSRGDAIRYLKVRLECEAS